MKTFYLQIFLCLAFILGCQGLGPFSPKGAEFGLKIDFTKAPTAEEVVAWHKVQKWTKVKGGWTNKSVKTIHPPASDARPVLINGNPVDKTKYPNVLRILSASGAGCTASLIGPQAILTAAHCATTGETVSFTTVDGKSYVATMERFAQWPGTDLDLNVGRVATPVTGIKPLEIRTDRFEKANLLVDMIGYGCITPGGGGGNDGILRMGQGKVTGAQAFDLILAASPSALCYGDSGGPVLYQGKQIGVNSKGNIQDTSYTTRTTLPESLAFFQQVSKSLGVEICGITPNGCGSGSTPPVPPGPSGPKQYMFENEALKLQVLVK